MTAAAVLFDLDGLLVDSEPVWYDVEFALVERLGGGWAPEHQAACIGGTIDQTCRYILELTGASMPVDQMQAELLDAMVQHFQKDLPLHDGALAVLDGVAARGVPVGVVSSSYRRLVDTALAVIGADRFSIVVAGDEVQAGKPAPDPYLTACARLNVAPPQVVVLEDASNGVLSAETAGCVVVAIPSVAPIEATPTRPVVRSLGEIDPDWLLSLV